MLGRTTDETMRVHGLANNANLCFINALLQVLFSIQVVIQAMTSANAFWASVVEEYRRHEDPVGRMDQRLREWFPGEAREQQCAFECFTKLVDSMPDTMLSVCRVVMHQLSRGLRGPTRRGGTLTSHVFRFRRRGTL